MQVTRPLLKVGASLFMVSVVLPVAAGAQNPDSLVGLLGSASWRTRSDAVARLNQLPVTALPQAFARTAIALLEREGTNPNPDREPGEGYGEYVIDLVQAVFRLDDERALRGMALIGIQTGRGPTEFVAKRGGAAIPYLDEAWARDSLGRPAVVRTWGYMLGPFAGKLARRDSLEVVVRLLRAAREQPQAFTWAADIARLAEAVPLLERIAGSGTHEIIRRHAATVSVKLRALRDSLPAAELARRLEVWVSAACEPTGITASSRCATLASLARDVREQVGTMGVRGALDSLVQEGRRAFAGGALSEVEDALIAGNAEYLKTRP